MIADRLLTSSFRRRPESRYAFVHARFFEGVNAAENPASLGSGFRRNDALDVFFVVYLIPEAKN